MKQMYKVFVNQKTIYLTRDVTKLQLNVEDVLVVPQSKAALVDEYHRFINNPYAVNLYLLCPGPSLQLFRDFLSLFVTINAAGGLVVNPKGQILFINRYGKWDLPKGKIEMGEEKKVAAQREVEEETSIGHLQIIRPLILTRHLYEERSQRCIKHTWWYHMQTSNLNIPVPQKEEGITQAVWIDRKALKEVMLNTYPSIIEVINSYLATQSGEMGN